MNKNLVKKILSIVAVSLVCALVVLTIVLAIVPKKLNNPIMTGYQSITVYKDKVDQTYYYTANTTEQNEIKQNEIFTKIQELHEASLQDSLLSALFQGVGGFDIKVVTEDVNNAITDVKTNYEGSDILVFNYASEQTLKLDGEEEYKHSTSMFGSQSVKFNMMVMPIGSSDSFEECTIYLTKSDKSCEYQLKFLAHQNELASYLKTLEFPVVG